jgi:hypothetical protein
MGTLAVQIAKGGLMGLNASGLGLMSLARAEGACFGRVVTIARQQLTIGPAELEDFFRKRGRTDIADRVAGEVSDGYCEAVIRSAFGAEIVHSIDASDYEHASFVHDMNQPIEPEEQYSVVLDFGTLEHVLNVPVAFDNVAKLCANGGHIMHMLPSNNCSGHGFYQFSPEFFFQIYSEARGFAGTRVFAVPMGSPEVWYEVRAPHTLKSRVNITSRDELYLLVLTQKIGAPVSLTRCPVQQSDYEALWAAENTARKGQRRRNPLEQWARALTNSMRHRRKMARRDATNARADMIRHRVFDLTRSFHTPAAATVAAEAARDEL